MTELDPHPVSDSLDRHLKEVLTQIPTGKRGELAGTVTTSGVEASVAVKIRRDVTVSGWAGREWGGRGWSAGARGSWSF